MALIFSMNYKFIKKLWNAEENTIIRCFSQFSWNLYVNLFNSHDANQYECDLII